jgi:hypothetical protein
MHGIIVAIIIATKSSFQLMASQLRCSTIGPKTHASSDVAPQRAGSTRYALAFLTQRECTELRSVLTAIPPLQTMRWVPHYPHFSSLLFSTKIDGSIQFVPNFNRISLMRNTIAVSTDQLYIRAFSMCLRLRLHHITRLLASF